MSSFITDNKPYPPYASLYIRGRELEPEKITGILGVCPTRGYKRGDKRGKQNVWPHGIWMLESSGELESNDPIKHIEWLVEKLEPARLKLIDILKDETIEAEMSCFWIMPTSHEILIISPILLNQVGSFNIKFEFSVYSEEKNLLTK
jgi:hypothetical protein